MALVEVDIPKKSQRMLSRNASDSNFHSDVDEPIFIQPIQEKPCFALSILIPKSPEERRKIHQKHFDEKCNRASKMKIISENSDSMKKEKEMLKDSSQSTIMHLRENLRKLRYDQSLIHQWGVYTTEPIRKNEAIIEYIGEIIRLRVADKRQVQYEAEGNNGSYIFQLEKDKLIDATHKGGLARFINHSCSPNCATQVKRFDGQNHIIIYAKRDIHPYEELCYDYQMEYEPKEKRIRCLCGSPNCKQWLNWSEKAEMELNYKWSNGTEHKRRFPSAPDDHDAESNDSDESSKTNELSEQNEANESNQSEQQDEPDEPDKTLLLKEELVLDDIHEFDEEDNSEEKDDQDEQDEFDIHSFNRQQKKKTSRKSNKVNKMNKPNRSNSQNDTYTRVYDRKSINSKSVTRHFIPQNPNIQLPKPIKQELPIPYCQIFINQFNTGNLRPTLLDELKKNFKLNSAPTTPVIPLSLNLGQQLLQYQNIQRVLKENQPLPPKIVQNQYTISLNMPIGSSEIKQQSTNQIPLSNTEQKQTNPQNIESCDKLENKEDEKEQLEKPEKK